MPWLMIGTRVDFTKVRTIRGQKGMYGYVISDLITGYELFAMSTFLIMRLILPQVYECRVCTFFRN